MKIRRKDQVKEVVTRWTYPVCNAVCVLSSYVLNCAIAACDSYASITLFDVGCDRVEGVSVWGALFVS
jgi:hypothetical protein